MTTGPETGNNCWISVPRSYKCTFDNSELSTHNSPLGKKDNKKTMSELGSERSKPWNIYSISDPAPSQTGEIDREAPWKSFGTSMNAISFGFVATAILISMFLIMAIFEHLFRPNPSFSTPQEVTNGSSESRPLQKLGNPQTVPAAYASDFSVVMPGQQLPTYIAQPAPLPCPREKIYWPNHEQNLVFP